MQVGVTGEGESGERENCEGERREISKGGGEPDRTGSEGNNIRRTGSGSAGLGSKNQNAEFC